MVDKGLDAVGALMPAVGIVWNKDLGGICPCEQWPGAPEATLSLCSRAGTRWSGWLGHAERAINY